MKKISADMNRFTDDTENDLATPAAVMSTPKRTPKSKKRRQPNKTSIIWRHVNQDTLDSTKTNCQHCVKYWINLNESTSNPIAHFRTSEP